MSLPASIEAVKNERTGKLFIVLDWEVDGTKIKVINPNGDVLDVVKLIFKMDEPIKVQAANFQTAFTEAQVAKLERWEQDQYAETERKRLEKAAKASQTTRKVTPRKTKSSANRDDGIINRNANAFNRRPNVQWESSTLTFYRHRIESLKPNDIFSIIIDGQGTFQITKTDFLRVFNHVIMNPEYQKNGTFRFDEIPEAARAYMQP